MVKPESRVSVGGITIFFYSSFVIFFCDIVTRNTASSEAGFKFSLADLPFSWSSVLGHEYLPAVFRCTGA